MGISEAFYIPAALALIADYHTGHTRSRAVGLHQMAIYCGVILGGFGGYVAEDPMLGKLGGSHSHCAAHFGMLYAVPLMLILRDAAGVKESNDVQKTSAPQAISELLTNTSFILLVLYFTLPALAGWVVRDWMPAILKQKFEIGQGHAGVAATIYWQAAAIVGAIVGGVLADRWVERNNRGRIFVSALGMGMIVPAIFGLKETPLHSTPRCRCSNIVRPRLGLLRCSNNNADPVANRPAAFACDGLRNYELRQHQLWRPRRLGLRRFARSTSAAEPDLWNILGHRSCVHRSRASNQA